MGKHVLVVDDDDGLRSALRHLLEQRGHIVVSEVGDGTSAVETARRLEPDVVILDVGLPDIDGFDVALTLSRHRPAPLIILMSSRKGPGDDERAHAVGATAYIDKSELAVDLTGGLLERGRRR